MNTELWNLLIATPRWNKLQSFFSPLSYLHELQCAKDKLQGVALQGLVCNKTASMLVNCHINHTIKHNVIPVWYDWTKLVHLLHYSGLFYSDRSLMSTLYSCHSEGVVFAQWGLITHIHYMPCILRSKNTVWTNSVLFVVWYSPFQCHNSKVLKMTKIKKLSIE